MYLGGVPIVVVSQAGGSSSTAAPGCPHSGALFWNDRMRSRREETVDTLPEVSSEATQQLTLEEEDLRDYMDTALQGQ